MLLFLVSAFIFGFLLSLFSLFAPYIGFGEKEEFILYRIIDIRRRDVFIVGSNIALLSFVLFIIGSLYKRYNYIINSRLFKSIKIYIEGKIHTGTAIITSIRTRHDILIRRCLIVSMAVFLTVILPFGIMLAGAEYWIRLSYAEQVERDNEALSATGAAYDTPGQTKDNSPGMSRNEYHYFAGYIPIANISVSGYQTDNGYRVNNGHFRYDKDFPQAKPHGEIRVFVTGGSTAAGMGGVNQEQLYTTIIEQMFAERYDVKVRVISAGVMAYSSTQERIFLENHILDFAPDVVVMFSGWNDTYYAHQGRDIQRNSDYFQSSRYLADFFEEGVVILGDKEKKMYLRGTPPHYDEYSLKTLWSLDKLIRNTMNPPLPSLPIRQAYAGVERNVRIVAALSKSFNFEFVYYLQPTVLATTHLITPHKRFYPNTADRKVVIPPHPYYQDDQQQIDLAEYNIKMYAIYREWLPKLARELGVYFHDADKAISTEQRAVFTDWMHFGDRGNRLIALHLFEVIETVLSNRGVLPPVVSADPTG